MAKPKVVKLAQQGFDVKVAGDEHLVYNSNWPLLKIHKQGSWSTSDFTLGNNQVVATHDLGYPAFFMYFINNNIETWDVTDNATIKKENRSEFQGSLVWTGALSMDNKQLLYLPGGFSGHSPWTGPLSLYYYIFALDLSKDYQAPKIKSGGVIGPRNTQTVFKLAKPGKDINSKNLEDYIIHSDTRSPLIHSVNPGITATNSDYSTPTFVAYHHLGYTPMFFGFFKNNSNYRVQTSATNGTYSPLYTGSGGGYNFLVDTDKVYFQDVAGVELSIVILKDPFDITNTTRVTI